jgi:hypothetical protein
MFLVDSYAFDEDVNDIKYRISKVEIVRTTLTFKARSETLS